MRLICPNCSAQYEIDASLIPDEGRDVQCSNCGHNWFELPPASEVVAPPPELEVEPASEPEPATEAEPEPVPEPEPAPEPEPEIANTPQDASTNEQQDTTDEDDWDWPRTRAASLNVPKDETPLPERPRRKAELAALEILKEEADRELARRKEDAAAPIETQPDLALEDPKDRETPSRALRARMARLRGEDDDEDESTDTPADSADDEAAYRAPRKDLLPDIDEINSSLRPAGLAGGERTEEEEAEHRRGFRMGFIGVVGVVVLGIVTYTQAPAIAGAFPGTESALIGYVDWANGVRDMIGGLVGG